MVIGAVLALVAVLVGPQLIDDAMADGLGNPTTVVSATMTGTQVSTNNVVINCERSSLVGLQLKLTGATAAVTNAVVATFDESLDGSTWKTAARTMSLVPTGTTAVNVISNFTMNATAFLRLATINNDNATNCTVVLKSYSKDGI
jgi:hypothetical protein